jgi:hypothetical protein
MISKKLLAPLIVLMVVLLGALLYLIGPTPEETPVSQAPLDDPTINVTVVEEEGKVTLSPRRRSVFKGGAQSKRRWIKRMRFERRFQRDLCGKNSYLVRCLQPYKNPMTRMFAPFSRRDCIDAITTIVSKEANSGAGQQLEGAFFADHIPQKIDAGNEMDVMADRLGFRIGQVLLPKLARRGGKHRETPYCNALEHRAFEVDGN